MIVDELVAILGFDVRGEGELRKFNRGLDGAERKARSFSASLVALGGAAVAALGGLAIGRQVGDFIGSIATVNAEFETYEATLKTITGSAEEARRSMDWITEFGRTTPYEAGQVTEAFVRLKSYGIDPMDGSLRAVGDAASAMGKGLMQGVEAIADAVTGENERLKEFGIRAEKAGDQITYTWTENGKVLTKTVKKDAVEIQKALMGIFGRFNGAMDEQSKTWVGMTSNLADNWTEFLREIGGAGYYDDIKRRLQGVLDFTNRAFESGLAGDVAKRISDGLIRAMNIAEHLATQAYRIGRGFYYAADGIVALTAKATGLSKSMAAAGLGAGLLATSALGRRAMLAVARRVPMVAAMLVLDDIISGLNGENSLVGSLDGGQEALDGIKASFEEVLAAADELAGTINTGFGLQQVNGETQVDTLMRSFKEYLKADAVDALRGVGQMIRDVASALKTIDEALKNPEAAWERFVTAAIAQLDRLIAAVDEKLGGALTRFGFVEEPKAQPNPNAGKITTTGQAPRAPSTTGGRTGMADLVRSGMQTVEGMKAEYGLTEEAIMKVALDLSQFLTPANQALRIKADLSRGFTAVANLDITQWMANADRAETRLRNLQAAAGGASGAVRSRPQVAQSAAAP